MHLTKRELDVLGRIVAGARTKQIASDLGISPRTVDAHRDKIKAKLGANTLADIIRISLKTIFTGQEVIQ